MSIPFYLISGRLCIYLETKYELLYNGAKYAVFLCLSLSFSLCVSFQRAENRRWRVGKRFAHRATLDSVDTRSWTAGNGDRAN